MKFVWFTQSLVSCWNNGNAHFLRGVLRALAARGHDALAAEPEESWSFANLQRDHGEDGLRAAAAGCGDVPCRRYYGAGDIAPR
ncbi:hypothetical protein J4558_14530 [Leptolyngbya sp. 15MV]|nr:hypothetical protein J4558_14530 [Leptolyngbya sp. 15MV]